MINYLFKWEVWCCGINQWDIWFKHDGKMAHTSLVSMLVAFLQDPSYPVNWLPYSPDLCVYHYFLWGNQKCVRVNGPLGQHCFYKIGPKVWQKRFVIRSKMENNNVSQSNQKHVIQFRYPFFHFYVFFGGLSMSSCCPKIQQVFSKQFRHPYVRYLIKLYNQINQTYRLHW